MQFFALLVSCGLLIAVAAPTRADTGDEEFFRAQALFDEGIALFNQGRFEEACPKFEKSLAIVAGVGTRGKLAECWARLGRIASSYKLYLEVKRLAESRGEHERAVIAQKRADDLKAALSYMIISPGPSATSGGFHVTRNGLTVEPRTYNAATPVDPGEYVIAATAQGHVAWTATVRIGRAESRRVDIPALAALVDNNEHYWTRERIVSGVCIGMGAASLLGGTTLFALRARSKWSDALDAEDCTEDSGGTVRCTPGGKGEALAKDAVNSANLANLSAGFGLVAISAGVFLWWRASRAGANSRDTGAARKDRDPPQKLGLAPTLSPGSAGIVIWRHF